MYPAPHHLYLLFLAKFMYFHLPFWETKVYNKPVLKNKEKRRKVNENTKNN